MAATAWSEEEPSAPEIEKAQAWLIHLHKTAGHPSNRNLARSIKDAGKPTWLVKMAADLKCRACEELKEGDRLIPRASLTPPPRPWEFIGMNVTELTDLQRNVKMKVVLIMDLGTHLVHGDQLSRMTSKGKTPETTAMVMEAVLRLWLVDKPKPKWWICDSAGGFDNGEFTKESTNLNIGIQLTPGQSPWAHCKLERMVKRVKNTFYLMQTDLPDVDPKLIYYTALGAVNRQEVVRGFTPVQWCYGKHDDQDDIESEERRHLQGADVSKSVSPSCRRPGPGVPSSEGSGTSFSSCERKG
jgi:hypothetical protein